MADGMPCIHCGYQETDHDLGRAKRADGLVCRRFVRGPRGMRKPRPKKPPKDTGQGSILFALTPSGILLVWGD
jgi:hypothetical protein